MCQNYDKKIVVLFPQQISKRMCPEICGSEVADQKLPCTLAVRGLEEPRWGSSRYGIQKTKKNPAENYMAPDPANFVHQLPQKESCWILWCGPPTSASAPSKRIRRKIIWLQIPPTFFISSLKKNTADWKRWFPHINMARGVSFRRISKRIPPNLKKNLPQ